MSIDCTFKMNDIISRSFQFNIAVLKILGVYKLKNASTAYVVKSYVSYVLFLILLIVLTSLDAFLTKHYEAMQVIFLTDCLGFCSKILILIVKEDRIRKCIFYFEKPYFTGRNLKEKKILDDCVRICRRNSLIYIIGLEITIIVFFINPTLKKELPLPIWLPYDYKAGTWSYLCTYIYVFIAITYNGFGGIIIDVLIAGLLYHATSQLMILKYRLQNLHKLLKKSAKRKQNKFKSPMDAVHYNLKRCVEHHNKILQFVDELENSFSLIIFSQFAGTMFGLCFCCIGVITTSITSLDFTLYSLCLSVISGQVFLYCYYGTLLFEENNTLLTAAYISNWYEYDMRSKKILLTLMERAKRPMNVTAGKILELTLETFIKLVKSSYSLIAVFSNVR